MAKISDDFDRDYFMDADHAVAYRILDDVLNSNKEKERKETE